MISRPSSGEHLTSPQRQAERDPRVKLVRRAEETACAGNFMSRDIPEKAPQLHNSNILYQAAAAAAAQLVSINQSINPHLLSQCRQPSPPCCSAACGALSSSTSRRAPILPSPPPSSDRPRRPQRPPPRDSPPSSAPRRPQSPPRR